MPAPHMWSLRHLHAPRVQAALLIAALAGAGLLLRLILLVDAGWRYDYDEGMVGLQALHIVQGDWPVFHPGQPYLAALDSYVIAALFGLSNANAVTLKLVPWLLSGLFIATTGWLGWRAFNPRVGVLSALLAALAPAYLLVTGTKAWGATAETLLLGNLVFITTSAMIDPATSPRVQNRAGILLGLITGIAFWVSPLIAFYALPVVIVVLWHGRAAVRRIGLAAAAAFLAGSSPFWAFNLQHNFASFTYFLGEQGDTWGTLWPVLRHLNDDLAPRMVSGDPGWGRLSWNAIWFLQIFYQGGLLGLVIWSWRGPWPKRAQSTRQLLALFTLAMPLIYLFSGYGSRALNEFGFDATGRYVLVIHSILPIGVAALADGAVYWRRRLWPLAAAVLASIVTLNLLGAMQLDPEKSFTSPYYTRQPVTLAPLIDFLDDQHIRHVWTDVGIAHVLMFETGEHVLAADWYDVYAAKGLVRFPDVPLAIAAADRVAFVEVILPDQRDAPIERAFKQTGVPHWTARVTPDMLVIIPQAPVDPAALGDALGYQF